MLDDTCYFLPSPTAEEAAILTALCNDPITRGLIGSLIFRGAKRPITKKLLQRLDLSAVLATPTASRFSPAPRTCSATNWRVGLPNR